MAVSRQRFRVWNSSVVIGVLLDRELGDGLADVAVVVDDLRERVAPGEELGPVPGGAGADRAVGERRAPILQAQRL